MDQNLLKPSLQTEWTETKSYDIQRLWYPVFFGGLVTTLIMASRNAFWLRVRPAIVYYLIGFGIVILLGQVAAITYFTNGNWDLAAISAITKRSNIRLIRRAIALGVYLVYYLVMKNRFQQHMVTKGELKPLLVDSIILVLVGGILEGAIVMGGVYLLSHVF